MGHTTMTETRSQGIRVVVTGGGTGGHIYPALAVAAHLIADPAVAAVHYVGKTTGLEKELAEAAGLPFSGVCFTGMPRTRSFQWPFHFMGWLLQLIQATWTARAHLRRIAPQVVFGTGGYVSAPILLAAAIERIPYAVHESDAQPGLANRLMARGARLITTSFAEGAVHLQAASRQQVLVTGNPIRGDIGQLDKKDALAVLDLNWPTDRLVLLVAGGSQGARRINETLAQVLPVLLNDWGLGVIHLTGRALYEETLARLDAVDPSLRSHPAYCVRPYETAMAALLAAADIAVCRAGSLSLSEMMASGTPTVLIPYPFAAADHQRKNALAAVRGGASVLLNDADCTLAALLDALHPLVQDGEHRESMRQAALALGRPHATETIAQALKNLATSP